MPYEYIYDIVILWYYPVTQGETRFVEVHSYWLIWHLAYQWIYICDSIKDIWKIHILPHNSSSECKNLLFSQLWFNRLIYILYWYVAIYQYQLMFMYYGVFWCPGKFIHKMRTQVRCILWGLNWVFRMYSCRSFTHIFTQPFIQTQIKENIKAPRHWPVTRKIFPFDDVITDATELILEYRVHIWWDLLYMTNLVRKQRCYTL